MEAKGLQLEANKFYDAALGIDPKAGCRKDLARLRKSLGQSTELNGTSK
jgi:hypothetical protein